MANPQMVMYEEEFAQVQAVTDRLVQDANARVVFVVDKKMVKKIEKLFQVNIGFF